MPGLNLFLFLTLALVATVTYHLYTGKTNVYGPNNNNDLGLRNRHRVGMVPLDSASIHAPLSERTVSHTTVEFWDIPAARSATAAHAGHLHVDFIEQMNSDRQDRCVLSRQDDCA